MSEESFISKVTPLTQTQRIEARHTARKAVISRIGKEPKREDYSRPAFDKYPAWVTFLIGFLIVLVMFAAFIVSAMRLFHIGSMEFFNTIEDKNSATIAGAMIIILSEASAILFTIAVNVIGESRVSKAVMIVSAIIATCIALSGNYYVALYQRHTTVFSWFDTFAPPLVTLSAAFVLERFIFRVIEQRQKDRLDFENDLRTHREKTSNPEDYDSFDQDYANAIWDSLLSINRTNRRQIDNVTIIDLLRKASSTDKTILVQREISADTWYRPSVEEKKEDVIRVPEVAHSVGFLTRQPLPANRNQQSYMD